MHIHEFELRYRAFVGLQYRLKLDWTQDEIVSLTKISSQGNPDKQIQELSPQELQEITIQTYTSYKKDFLTNTQDHFIEDLGTSYSVAHYIERLEYELKVIKEMGFNSYFLIVADFIGRAKKNKIIVGPGRGSGAGSLLARLVQITDINPLSFGLLFERFLNPARVNMPDFDIDFEDERRESVIQYVTQKYGYEKVSSIGTYMKMASKASFKDCARAIGLPFDKSNYISNLIPEQRKLYELLYAEETPEELRNLMQNDKQVEKTMSFGARLEGNLRQLGVHACGVIIAPEPISQYSATQYIKDDKNLGMVCQYDGPTLENIGLLKMDFLGLRNLSVIKHCIKIIQKRYTTESREIPAIFKEFEEGSEFHPPLNEKHTFEKVFQIGNTTGIFQFESAGMRKYLIALKADSINDLVAMNALYRPGPMEFIPSYIDRKLGKEKVIYMQDELRQELTQKYSAEVADIEEKKLIEDLDPIMNVTYGIAVYQEQLMFLVQAMAGFSLGEADMLRRGVGKKKKEIIEQLKQEFMKRGITHKDYKPETTKYIYEKMIEPAASYSFNKSHSVCYSYIAYQTAYLKAHYPIEFYASLIRSVEEDSDEMSNYIYEAQAQGIEVLSPDISLSFNHVSAQDDKIRLGFFGIKGIGFEIGEYIQEERKKNGKFTNLEDFLKRCQKIINKKSLESLSKAGALDEFTDRKTILENIEQCMERSKSSNQMSMGLFGGQDVVNKITFHKSHTTTIKEKMQMEYDVFKTFVSVHPLDGLYKYLKKYSFISQFVSVENFGNFEIIGYIKDIKRARKKGFFIKIEDASGHIEFFTTDILNFQKFDMIIARGFKGKGVSIEKIIKTSREKLVSEAGQSYDPNITMIEVKKMRVGEDLIALYASNEITKKTEPDIIEKTEEIPQVNIDLDLTEDLTPQDTRRIFEFKIPENIQKIQEVSQILKQFPGEITINIGPNQFKIDEIGHQKLIDILR